MFMFVCCCCIRYCTCTEIETAVLVKNDIVIYHDVLCLSIQLQNVMFNMAGYMAAFIQVLEEREDIIVLPRISQIMYEIVSTSDDMAYWHETNGFVISFNAICCNVYTSIAK